MVTSLRVPAASDRADENEWSLPVGEDGIRLRVEFVANDLASIICDLTIFVAAPDAVYYHRVRTLLRERELLPGVYEFDITWKARDDSNEAVPPGRYQLRAAVTGRHTGTCDQATAEFGEGHGVGYLDVS